VSDKLNQILIIPTQSDYDERIAKLLTKKAPAGRFKGYDSKESQDVLKIIREIGEEEKNPEFPNSDAAVAGYTQRFDGVNLEPEQFRVPTKDLERAHGEIDRDLMASIRRAIANVRKYQTEIFIGANKPGGIRYTPIKRIGICVPGAAAPLPSTVIMTAVPALVAGVEPEDIVVVSPPRCQGSIHPVTLAVCYELGITEVYRVGGAQAVAALASDKGTIPKVDKIVGPGNQWVQTAKKMVSGDYVGIDSIMGPSEVLIIANEEANPAWIAADMLSQAEHGSDSSAIVVTHSEAIGRGVLDNLRSQLRGLSRAAEAKQSLTALSAIVVVRSISEAIKLANELACEHLEVQCGDKSREIADKITNAGAIFIGSYTPVAVGDYWAGPSHTLPTEMRAKFSSALTSNDFVKSISIIEYSKEQLAASAEDIIRLAEAEGLDAHAKSVRIRQQS
jgi:histidinol dehydrogenase